MAKEILAGIAGAEVDKLFETKGLDFLDREKAKHHARQQPSRCTTSSTTKRLSQHQSMSLEIMKRFNDDLGAWKRV